MLLAASVSAAWNSGKAPDPWAKARVLTVGRGGSCADLHTAVARAKDGTVIRLMPGTHVLNRELRIAKNNIRLTGDGRAEIEVRAFENEVSPAIWIGENVQCSNIVIDNVVFRYIQIPGSSKTGGNTLFYARSVTGFTVNRCDIAGFNEAINLCYCSRIRVTKCTLKNKTDITFAFGSDLTIEGNRLGRNLTVSEFTQTAVEGPIIIRDNSILK